jgi:multicomponent Na+:H+ antiporter subunit A
VPGRCWWRCGAPSAASRPCCTARLPTGLDADSGYRRAVTAVDRFARAVTGRTQVGSLPVYLAITLLTFAAAPATALAIGTTPVHARLWDTPTQALIGGIVLIAAATATRAHRRFTAVLLTGAVGYGVALLYLVQGAPDLALTQLLVETVTLVAFVLVLRTLPRTFARRAARPVPVAGRMPPAGRTPVLARVPVLGRLHRFGIRRPVRLAVSAAVGITTAMLVLAAAGSRTADPVGPAYLPVAYPDGGGRNVVNVLLTDFRAMDTFGEISVIAIAAVGILSLVAAGRPATAAAPRAATTGGSRHRAGSAATFRPPESGMAGTRRYVVLEVAGRLLFHTIAVFSVYLLLAGHNLPGGGFAGGLVLGLALALRYLAGGSRDLLDVAPVPPAVVLGSGLALAALAGAGAWVFGGQFLQSAILERDVPVLGHVKVVTVVVFDTGVYLVVVGMVLAVLRGLGVEIARRTAQRESEAAERAGTS